MRRVHGELRLGDSVPEQGQSRGEDVCVGSSR